jgi:hypothetical protein
MPTRGKISYLGKIEEARGEFYIALKYTDHLEKMVIITIPEGQTVNTPSPIRVDTDLRRWKGMTWVFDRKLYMAEFHPDVEDDEIRLRIKHEVLKQQHGLARIERELQVLETIGKIPESRRAPIPPAVRLFVWQRDGGRCVSCGSNERLEFDHVIPLVLGGSDTERNLQLLCEVCNRQKGARLT